MSALKRTSTQRNTSFGQRGQDIWLHHTVGRYSSPQTPSVAISFEKLAQRLQPYLDQILSIEKKKSKPRKQVRRNTKRKPTLGKHLVKKQPSAFSPNMRPMKPPVLKTRKTRPKGKIGVSAPTEEPIIQQQEDSLPELPQIEPQPMERILPPPPPEESEMIETDTVRTEALPTESMEEDSIHHSPSSPPESHAQFDLNTPSSDTVESLIPQTVAVLKHDPVVYPKIPFMEQQNGSFVLVSLLEEIWDVDWEHPVSIKWGPQWSEHGVEIEVEVKDIRHNPNGLILWINGLIRLTRIGTSQGDRKVLHETLSIPFSSTILHPSLEKSAEENFLPSALPPYHDKVWTETGDWKAMLIANPLKMTSSEIQESNGFIRITGRIWWFRKQLLPLKSLKENDQV